ncbi:MAG: hypothetical protein JSW54_07085 [Fidelibacterota bacterium]|nr:MAG: hypothetical protein JSW54_07085 [Candidatus Neomarinimicrobiota bacterium]
MWSAVKGFFISYWKAIAIVGGIAAVVVVGLYFNVDAKVLALFALIAGFITNGFVALATLVSLIPFVGPLLVKILSVPLVWLLNALGYFISAVAIKKGYGAEVVSHRMMTFILLLGIVIGYIVGNLVPLN